MKGRGIFLRPLLLSLKRVGFVPISEAFPHGDYGDKRARNKRIGPGGGTRRLHQSSLIGGIMGPK